MVVARAGVRRFGRAQATRRRPASAQMAGQVERRNGALSEDAEMASSRTRGGAGNAEQAAIGRLKQLSVIAAAAVAVAFVALAFGVWQSASAGAAVDAATRNQVSVLVANRDIHAGDALAESDVTAKLVPEAYRASGVYQAQSAAAAGIVGGRALVDIPSGSQLNSGVVSVAGGDGRLSASLASGMEAVSVSVDDETGIAGQIKPLDHVRVVSVETASGGASEAVEICAKARVLSTGGDGAGEGVSYAAVTLEVTPDQANEVRAAQSSGRVSLQLIAAFSDTGEGA